MDIWEIIKHSMTPREFAKICSTSRASYALRQPLVAAEVCYDTDDDEQVLLRQLHLSRWPTCHSLCVNMWEVEGAMELSQAQWGNIDATGSTMPSLHCLHLIGRKRVPVTESSIEGKLVSLLARHASVVTMQVETIMMPLDVPSLQHLVLDIAHSDCWGGHLRWNHGTLFEAIKMLKGLKTLYIQSCSHSIMIYKLVDLTVCGHLQCVAVQGVAFALGLRLPSSCLLHANSVPIQVCDIIEGVARLLTGLTLCECSTWVTAWWTREWLRDNAPTMCNLKRLRLISSYPGEMPMIFGPRSMPSLEVLELDVQRDLLLYIHLGLALKRLVLITTGSLRVDEKVLMQGENETLKLMELYLQSGAAVMPSEMAALLHRFVKQPGARVKLSDHIKDKQH